MTEVTEVNVYLKLEKEHPINKQESKGAGVHTENRDSRRQTCIRMSISTPSWYFLTTRHTSPMSFPLRHGWEKSHYVANLKVAILQP